MTGDRGAMPIGVELHRATGCLSRPRHRLEGFRRGSAIVPADPWRTGRTCHRRAGRHPICRVPAVWS